MPSVTLSSGLNMYFEVYGSELTGKGEKTAKKPTMIFLHGGAGFLDHTPYVKFWSQFSDVAQVIFIDQRGSGRSQCDDRSTWTLKQWGQDVYDFCKALHINHPLVAGISYGGMVAQSYNIQFPEHPAALILSDTDAHIDREYMVELVKRQLIERNLPVKEGVDITNKFLDGPLDQKVIEDYFCKIVPMFGEEVEILDDFSMSDPKYTNLALGEYFLNGELLSFDFRKKLKNTKCPVLFLTGDQGPMHSLKTAKELIAAFPENKIEYTVYKNAKTACYELYPEKAAKRIRDFICSLN